MNNGISVISNELCDQYDKDGIIRIKLPDESQEFLAEFLNEASIWLKYFGNHDVKPTDMAVDLPKIAADDRALVGKLYKVSRRFPSVRRLSCDPWMSAVSAQLMRTEFPSCCHFINVRIDLPSEEKYLLPAHQDFPYIQESLNGVTWWIPFIDTPVEVGPPRFIYGSHGSGVIEVEEYDYKSTGYSGGKSFKIANGNSFPDHDYAESKPVKYGEALVFNTLLVHRSEPNLSPVARINTQLRFGDPLSQDSFDRNYPEGLYLGDSFSDAYPEYVVNKRVKD